MRLWTIQPLDVWKELNEKEYYVCDSKRAPCIIDGSFVDAYEWLVTVMNERCKKPVSVEYPVWAWHTTNWKHKKPDLRKSCYGKKGEKCVCLEIEIPDDEVILSDFEEAKNKSFKNALDKLLPQRMIEVIVELSGINPDKKVNEITKEERKTFVELITNLPLTIVGVRDYNEAIITKGGVAVKDVNPSTMESKKVSGLFFAGEVLDLDALTGGFNLQIAWSTGYLAGENAAM